MSVKRGSTARLNVRIKGTNLPGLRYVCSSDPAGTARSAVHVGIQRGRAVVDLVPGDAQEAVFELSVDVGRAPTGEPDFKGPYVHGKSGERFLYLSWGHLDASGEFAMFRRARLHLNTIEPADIWRAIEAGSVLEAHLPLSDRRGEPLCASVRPPTLRWQVASPAPVE